MSDEVESLLGLFQNIEVYLDNCSSVSQSFCKFQFRRLELAIIKQNNGQQN